MADKTTKTTVAIAIKRERPTAPRILVVTGFKLRTDKVSGLVEILLEAAGQRGERVTFDPVVTRSNLTELKRYAASVAVPEDDGAQKEDVTVGEGGAFANMVHFSQMGGRAETIFGTFSLADWVEATRQSKSEVREIKSYDSVVAMSTAGFQKKLLLELVLVLSQQETK